LKKLKEEYSRLTEQVRDLDRCMQKILGKTYTFEDKRTAHFLFSSIREHAKTIMLELIFINNKDQDQLQQERTKHCTTCKGKGWVHTFSTQIPKEASAKCPDCNIEEDEE